MLSLHQAPVTCWSTKNEGNIKHSYHNYWGNLGERDDWRDLDVDGRIILRWIFGKWEGVETGWSWLRIGTDGGHL